MNYIHYTQGFPLFDLITCSGIQHFLPSFLLPIRFSKSRDHLLLLTLDQFLRRSRLQDEVDIQAEFHYLLVSQNSLLITGLVPGSPCNFHITFTCHVSAA